MMSTKALFDRGTGEKCWNFRRRCAQLDLSTVSRRQESVTSFEAAAPILIILLFLLHLCTGAV